MSGVSTRRALRRGIDLMLRPTGARIVTRAEQQAVDRRQRSLVQQIYDAYASRFSPPLEDRPGRMELLHRLVGTEATEAMFLLHRLQQALDGPGDVCEFGVAQGATSALLANEIKESDRRLWLYDSFRGLSAPQEKDELLDDLFGLGSMKRYESTMAFPATAVRERVRSVGFPAERTTVVEGFIRPDLAADQLPATVAFAYLDFDLYEPIRTALNLMHPRTRPGSVLMVDDYGYFSSGPRTAVAEFLADHPRSYALAESPVGTGHFCCLTRRG